MLLADFCCVLAANSLRCLMRILPQQFWSCPVKYASSSLGRQRGSSLLNTTCATNAYNHRQAKFSRLQHPMLARIGRTCRCLSHCYPFTKGLKLNRVFDMLCHGTRQLSAKLLSLLSAPPSFPTFLRDQRSLLPLSLSLARPRNAFWSASLYLRQPAPPHRHAFQGGSHTPLTFTVGGQEAGSFKPKEQPPKEVAQSLKHPSSGAWQLARPCENLRENLMAAATWGPGAGLLVLQNPSLLCESVCSYVHPKQCSRASSLCEQLPLNLVNQAHQERERETKLKNRVRKGVT